MHRKRLRDRGFTTIELLTALVIMAVLAAVALPSYRAYIQRSKVPIGLDNLSSYAVRMEQYYQDRGCYASTCGATPSTNCGVAVPANGTVPNYTFSCTLVTTGTGAAQGFVATATGTGTLSGYVYSIDANGARSTTSHPEGANATCWTVRGSSCDT